MDIYWTREAGEQQTFSGLNLFENHLESTFVDVSLRGRQMTIENRAYVLSETEASEILTDSKLYANIIMEDFSMVQSLYTSIYLFM